LPALLSPCRPARALNETPGSAVGLPGPRPVATPSQAQGLFKRPFFLPTAPRIRQNSGGTHRQNAAFEEGVELVLDELRQVGSGSVFGVGEESRCVLLHQAVQRGLLGSVARAVDRGAIAMRPPGLVSVGLHALGMESLGWCSFSGRAGLRMRLWGDQLLPAPRRRACSGLPQPGRSGGADNRHQPVSHRTHRGPSWHRAPAEICLSTVFCLRQR
jgi:hypothetical protein